ncbi:MAG: OmpA family protein, partial [Taibaiella sp.]|nr:OmpA family protein [Taibaiella sp.]
FVKVPVKTPALHKEVVIVTPAPKIDITNLKKVETIRLDNILFLPGSHKIRSESETSLFHLYIVMKDHPTLKIRLEGHICCLKNTTHDGYDYDSQEYRLSENRAKAVYDYLVEKGIDEERLEYKGFGISKPLAWPERSFADENMNRRVEVRILEK